MKNIYITKSTGEKALFSQKKLRRSLQKAGAGPTAINDILVEISKYLYPGITTEEIYTRAFNLLRETSAPLAARYKLKKAIMELGPSGFPFERFVGELLRARSYDIQIGTTAEGRCVRHEIDVRAVRGEEKVLAECKYHNQAGYLCDVKTSLYVHARFLDVAAGMTQRGEDARFQGWIVTNTRFTDDDIRYGECAGMRLVGWNYPLKSSLKDMIDQEGLYPLTCLTTLTGREKGLLLEQGVVLVSELARREDLLARAFIHRDRVPGILKECVLLAEERPAVE